MFCAHVNPACGITWAVLCECVIVCGACALMLVVPLPLSRPSAVGLPACRLVRLVTHDAKPLLSLLQSFYSSLHRHQTDVQHRQVIAWLNSFAELLACLPPFRTANVVWRLFGVHLDFAG